MTPNLFLATQKVFSPHKWFRASKTERPSRRTECWSDPVPGQYEYTPGRGWFLIATYQDASLDTTYRANKKTCSVSEVVLPESPRSSDFVKLSKPLPCHYSQLLKRYLLDAEYNDRKRPGAIHNAKGKRVTVQFFRLDDGITWVQCWDEYGQFTPQSQYKLWFLDPQTQQFRHMRKSDDPNHHPSTKDDAHSFSQDSVSTNYVRAPGSAGHSPSTLGTRASSIVLSPLSNPTSASASRTASRRTSPSRNGSVALEDAKAALRRMAKEHQEAVAAAAAAKSRANVSVVSTDEESRARGRSVTRVAA